MSVHASVFLLTCNCVVLHAKLNAGCFKDVDSE